MIVAVLDTNVYISAACLPDSLPAHVVRLGADGGYTLAASNYIVNEFNDVIRRSKIQRYFGITEEAITEYSDILTEAANIVTVKDVPPVVLADPKDDHIVACAMAADADYIVSGDKHLLALGMHRGIQIVSPSQFLAELQAAGLDEPPPAGT